MDARNKNVTGLVSRIGQALLVFGGSGVLGILVDLDHLICATANHIPLWPPPNLYGCKVWHIYLPHISGGILGLAFALGIGFVLYLVYDTTWRTAHHK